MGVGGGGDGGLVTNNRECSEEATSRHGEGWFFVVPRERLVSRQVSRA